MEHSPRYAIFWAEAFLKPASPGFPLAGYLFHLLIPVRRVILSLVAFLCCISCDSPFSHLPFPVSLNRFSVPQTDQACSHLWSSVPAVTTAWNSLPQALCEASSFLALRSQPRVPISEPPTWTTPSESPVLCSHSPFPIPPTYFFFSFLETVLFVSLSQSQVSPQCPGPQ